MDKRRIISTLIILSIWSGIVMIINSLYVQTNWKHFALRMSGNSSTGQHDSSLLDGAVYVNLTVPSWEYVHDHVHTNLPGGHYRPTSCAPEYRKAIIIPHRNREHHLRGFLQHINPFLQRQRIEYKIFVIELVPEILFNRAILMNIGFVESVKSDNFSCFIFHDVDLLPEDIRPLYVCESSPVHMSVARSNAGYRLPYSTFFGGVSALTRSQFERVNGFSNVYFGWGGEDDDLEKRIRRHKMKIIRRSTVISRYRQMDHEKEIRASDTKHFLTTSKTRFHKDGLNSLNYTVVQHHDRKLFTWILVSINKTEIRNPWPSPVRKLSLGEPSRKREVATS